MFRITRDPSSGSSIQCLAKITVVVLSRPLLCMYGWMVMVLSCLLIWTDYVHIKGHDRTITVLIIIDARYKHEDLSETFLILRRMKQGMIIYIYIYIYIYGHVSRSECRTNSQCEDSQ